MALKKQQTGARQAEAGGKTYYTTGQVARLFGVTTRTVSNWCDQGRLPFIMTPSGHRRIPTSAVKGGKSYDAKLNAFQDRMSSKLMGQPAPSGEEIAEQVRARRGR